ncbi:Translation initiation factor eIF-2B subunit gamma [Sarcoptes scabiei]|uniref:Translation initiation factor eIF2B subunit gamma n=1 Tax=Sarcoptes scabiei TaxID=52283 RepID=A0A834RJM6_SARSC|nr:Translation initiation factor eIF-2B subunit gamma [Sarcoptes scabiei]
MEFQTLILAGGRGTRINKLLHGKPKCLLKIAQKPMIQYPLELLIRHRIKKSMIIVQDNEKDQIKQAIDKMKLESSIDIEYVCIPHSEDYGTAETLRFIRNKLNKSMDILILTCDLITDFDLERMLKLFKIKKCSIISLSSATNPGRKFSTPASKLENNKEIDYIGLDKNDDLRMILFNPDTMHSDSIALKRSLLKRCSNFVLHSDLHDCHVYILRYWLLDYLDYETDIRSIKLDLLPSIVRKQFRTFRVPKQVDHLNNDMEQSMIKMKKNLFDFIKISETERFINRIELIDQESNFYPQSSVQCYTILADSKYCLRVNSMLRFCQASRILMEESQNCQMVGHNSIVSDSASLRHTLIGSNCRIGDKVTMINCILQDDVVVESECSFVDSLICSESLIGTKTTLENCIIGFKQIVSPESRYKNEFFHEDTLEF